MTLSDNLKKALGLKDDAKDEDILTAVNSRQKADAPDLPGELRKALALKDDAGEAEILTAVNSMKTAAETPGSPDFAQYAPRSELNTAINRANAAEAKLAEREKTDQETAINSAVDQAIENGKITPATRDFYVAACRAEGGLENFKTFVEQAPALAGDGDKGKAVATNTKGELNGEEVAMCRAMGLTKEAYLESRDGESGDVSSETKKKEDA